MAGLYVIDASVAVKWFLVEPGTEQAEAVLHAEDDLAAPDLLRVETSAAITRAFRNGRASETAARAALLEAHALFNRKALALTETETLLARAEAIALELRHPLQDCVYLALAAELGGVLLTADPKLLARAKTRFPDTLGLSEFGA